MNFDRVKTTTTTTGTGDITVGAAAARCLPLSEIPVGTSVVMMIEDEAGTAWELSQATVTGATTFSRDTVLKGSNGTSKVNFGAGSKAVFCVTSASQLNAMQSVRDIAFATAVPLTRPGQAYMPQTAVTGPLTFTPAADAVRGALVYLELIADGVNTPNFAAFKEWGGSLGYDNRAGIANQVQFFRDRGNYLYSVSQIIGAVPVPAAATAVTMVGPTGGVVNTASSVFTVGTNGTRAGSVVVTPTPVAGVTFNPTSVTLAAGTGSATFTVTPAATGAKTIAVTNNGVLSNPASITYTATAAATAPGAPTIGTLTAGDGTVSQAFSAPGTDGGAAISNYTLTIYKVSDNTVVTTATGASSPISAAVANGLSVYGKVKATNSVNTGQESAASNSVAPVAAQPGVQYPRMVENPQTDNHPHYIESGTGPYSYTRVGAAGYPMTDLLELVDLGLGSGDGEIIVRQEAFERITIGVTAANTPPADNVDNAPVNLPYSVYTTTGNWIPYSGSTSHTPTNNVVLSNPGAIKTSGDWVRWKRVGSTLTVAVSKNQGSTWTTVYTWSNVPTTALNFAIGSNGVPFTIMSGSGLS